MKNTLLAFAHIIAINFAALGMAIGLWNVWAAYGTLNAATLWTYLGGIFIAAYVLFRSVVYAMVVTLTGWMLHRLAILEEKSLIAGLFLFLLLTLLTKQFYGKSE